MSVAAGAAGDRADETPPNDVVAGNADLARADALVADRHRVLRQQIRDDQRAGAEVVVRIGERDVRVDKLRRAVEAFSRRVTDGARPVRVGAVVRGIRVPTMVMVTEVSVPSALATEKVSV